MSTSQSYSIDDVPQWIDRLEVTSIRIVAHTMGPVAPGSRTSRNHWSMYLIHDKGSVRINLELSVPVTQSTRAVLTVTAHPYSSVSTSAVKYWNFGTSGDLPVYHVLEAIRRNGRSNYNMTAGGFGCRHWNFVVMADLIVLRYVLPTSFEGVTMESIIGYNYSRDLTPVPSEIARGTFVEDNQSASAGGASASSSTSASVTTSSQAPLELQENGFITVALVRPGTDVANSIYRFRIHLGIVEERGDRFFPASHQNGRPCMVYYCANSRRYYWTWRLDQPRC